MARTINQVIRETTLNYLSSINVTNPPSPQQIEEDILSLQNTEFENENKNRPPGSKWRIAQKLNFVQIATIMAQLYDICCIKTAGAGASSDFDLLAIYQEDGPNRGIYVTDTEAFRRIVKQYNYTITSINAYNMSINSSVFVYIWYIIQEKD